MLLFLNVWTSPDLVTTGFPLYLTHCPLRIDRFLGLNNKMWPQWYTVVRFDLRRE